jgi:hypothetical protein
MHWQFIVMASFVVAAVLFLAALVLYSSLRGSHDTGSKDLRLRTNRVISRSTGADCRG